MRLLPSALTSRALSPLLLSLALLCLPSAAMAMDCDAFSTAPRAKRDDAKVKRAVAVWNKLQAPFAALTGRSTSLAILARGAGEADEESGEQVAFKPTAHICPGAPPTVYVTWPMLELVYGEAPAYPESFLAFALGHELGHRINDLDQEGSLLGDAQRANYGTGYGTEEMADKRAAFFAASAGFSMHPLAAQKTVSTFLTQEHELRPWRVEMREQMLLGTLSSFDAYESLYQLAIAASLAGDDALGSRLLERADELIEGEGVPLPEIKALRAISLIESAAPHAPWRASLSHVPLPELRCQAFFPSHSALQKPPARGELRGDAQDEALEEAKRRLQLADKLLTQAETYHVAPLTLQSARACLALYRGEVAAAKEHLRATGELLGKKSPATLLSARRANEALAALILFVAEHPAPLPSDAKKAATWASSLKKLVKKVKRDNDEVSDALAILTKYPKLPAAERSATPTPLPACSISPAPAHPLATLPELPKEAKLGTCPEGWRLLHTLPGQSKDAQQMGVTTCAPKEAPASGPRVRLVHVHLPSTTAPPQDEIDQIYLFQDAISSEDMPTPQELTCGCNMLKAQGISDMGERAELLVCPSRQVRQALLVSDAAGHLVRLVRIETLPHD